jgi:aspartate-semialdehyde dehydrogenase
MSKIKVGILGATGNVGQRLIQLLENHPWFEVTALAASEKSAGKKYKEVVHWNVSDSIPARFTDMIVSKCEPLLSVPLVFSALDSTVAGDVEEAFAKKGYVVVSTASNHRMDKDVPMLIPEVNPEHLSLIKSQQKRWKSKGFIVVKPNCTTTGLCLALKPLHDAFGIKKIFVVTMQAVSGAGYPGVPSLDILDNVVPYIKGEEEKMEQETLKILGDGKIAITAHCNRVPVRDGHMENVTIEFVKKPTVPQVIKTLENFKGLPQELGLPSAPKFPIIYKQEQNRPQPVLDRDTGRGMVVTVGRARKTNILDISLTLLVHNTLRGAAGGAVLTAELLRSKKFI